MFKHKPRVDEIPDFKGFLVLLKKINPELHDRYMAEIKKAVIADVSVFVFFLVAITMAILALVSIYGNGYLGLDAIVEIVIFLVMWAPIIISSIFGRRAHTQAIRIETEIVAEYHQSGFKEQ
nr:hypothetical protein [Candidatus Sigynarchaeota archaeon]